MVVHAGVPNELTIVRATSTDDTLAGTVMVDGTATMVGLLLESVTGADDLLKTGALPEWSVVFRLTPLEAS